MNSYFQNGWRFKRYGAGWSKKTVSKTKKMASVMTAEVMWAVAAYATRVNGNEYVREAKHDSAGTVIQLRNRDIIKQQVRAGLPDLTDQDYEVGAAARRWHQGSLNFKVLRGGQLGDFEKSLSQAVQKEEFSNFADAFLVAVVASQIVPYLRGLKQQQFMDTVDTTPLAPVGHRLIVEGQVVRSTWSTNYGTWYVTIHTACNRAVFFSTKQEIASGKTVRVHGTVRSHRRGSTQLNRIRIL